MKMKEKKASKRTSPTNGEIAAVDQVVKPPKKAKLIKDDQEENKVDKPAMVHHTSLFTFFKEITHKDHLKRINTTLHLLRELTRPKAEEKRQSELAYTLKRLVRGCGASTNFVRTCFYTSLLALFKAFNDKHLSTQQVFDTMQKELHVGASIANKEDADAIVGKILICGALLYSGRLESANSEFLEKITNTLLQATKHRTYHASLGYSFMIQFLEMLKQEQFESSVWPLLRQELIKPWPKQTLQTIYCLLGVLRKFPSLLNAKFLKAHFGGVELLNEESFPYLRKIFWEHSNTNMLTHPAFELFGAHIATNAKLSQFWTQFVDPGLASPSKPIEIGTLKIAAEILNNLSVAKTNTVDLLSENFMHMVVEGLKNLKPRKDPTLRAFYGEFLEAVVTCCAKLPQDAQKVALIRRLILPPGAFNIEKYTSTRIVHQMINSLGEEGVQQMFTLYKSIFLATLPKNVENSSENWLNLERLNAGYMLQHLLSHKSVQNSYEWREGQLRFLLTCGLFYVNDSLNVCKKEAAGSFSKDFGEQCKKMFYASLQGKLHDLQREKNLLSNLVNYCNESMPQKHATKYLRIKHFDESIQTSWKSMYIAVLPLSNENVNVVADGKSKKKKKFAESSDKLELVFHILLLNMGLHLLREPEMAAPAIDDLLKCMQRTNKEPQTSSRKSIVSKEAGSEDKEPEWIEVVVDLFLHLLSQNANALRNIVNALFPHLCSNLNLSAVHQILAMLDMKDGNNPLSTKAEDEEVDEEEDADAEEEEDERTTEVPDNESENESENETENESESDDDEVVLGDDDDDDEEDEDDEAEDDGDEEISATNKLRNAISQVLIDSGGGAQGAEDDMESIDLNDMTEEDGKKLDEALANAFKAMKKTSNSSAQGKKSKSYRVKTTTVMHFRIRVLDLIEIYLQQQPTLLISIEIMLALSDMLEYCIGEELQPLQTKVEKVLCKLTALKTYPRDADVKENNLVDFIRLIVEKKLPAASFELTNKLRNKCIGFLIMRTCDMVDSKPPTKVIALCREYLLEFVKLRNPIVNITLLSEIFKLRWIGVWDLAVVLAEQGINMQTRVFRRIQIYEILSVLYKNYDLPKLNVETCKKELKKIEKILSAHIKLLSTSDNAKQSPKEFQTLLELLVNAHRAHARLNSKSSTLTSADLCDAVQEIRRRIRLESMQMYQRYCATFKLQVVHNKDVQLSEKRQNGNADMEIDLEENDKQPQTEIKSQKQAEKRKQSDKDFRKEKKAKKAQRMEAASKGLNGGIYFAQTHHVTTTNGDVDDGGEETESDTT